MSILKPRKPRQPLQAVNLGHNDEEEDTAEVRRRRVSFAGVKKTKEFNADAESLVICDTPAYEEEFTASSDSSQIVKNLNSPSLFKKSINEKESSGDSDMVLSCVNEEYVPVRSMHQNYQFNYSSKNPQDVVANSDRSSGYSCNGQFQDQVNFSEDSMDITGLGDPPESPNNDHCTSNMNLCGESFMQNSPRGNQKNYVQQIVNKQLFDRSSVNTYKNNQSSLSYSNMSGQQPNKENFAGQVSDQSKLLKHESLTPLPSNFNRSCYNSSYMSVTELNPVVVRNHASNSLSSSQLSDLSKPLCSQSPAPKRYRLSDFPDSDMEMSQNDLTLPKDSSYHHNSSQVSFTYAAGVQFGLNFNPVASCNNTSNFCKPLDDSNTEVSITADISKNKLPNFDECKSDTKDYQSNIPTSHIPDKVCPAVEKNPSDGFSFSEFESPNNDHDSEETSRKEDESSGESMDLSHIAEKLLNLKKQPNNNDIVDNFINAAQGNQFHSSLIKPTNQLLMVNGPEAKKLSLLQISSFELTNNQTSTDNRDVSKISDGSVIPTPDLLHELKESDIIDCSLNSVRNESKRKLDKMKMDDSEFLKVGEARVDQVFSSASCIAVRRSQGLISDREPLNVSSEKEIIQQDALSDDIKHDKLPASSLHNDHSVNKSDSELHSGLMEMDNLSHEPIIEVSHLPEEPFNEVPLLDHKLGEPINESLMFSDHLNKSKRPSNYFMNESCGTVKELSSMAVKIKSQHSDDGIGTPPLPAQLSDPFEEISQSPDLFENQSHVPKNRVSLINTNNVCQEHAIISNESDKNRSEKELTPEKFPPLLTHKQLEPMSLPLRSPFEINIEECPETSDNSKEASVNCTSSSKHSLLRNDSHFNDEICASADILADNSIKLTSHPESELSKDVLKDLVENDAISICDKDRTIEKQPVDIYNKKMSIINELVLNMSVSDEIKQSVMEEEHVLDSTTSSASILSDVKLPGKACSPLQWHNKSFMQDLNYHFWEWTQWRKTFFKKSVILTVKVPWVQFDSKTPFIDVSLSSEIVDEDDALNFCSVNLVQRLTDSKSLAKFSCIGDSEEMFAFIQKEVDRLTIFYESLYDAYFYKALNIINERLVIRVVNFKRMLAFDVFISLTNWMQLSENDISIKVSHGKVSVAQIKSIFSSIPNCKEKFYEFVCALESL